MLAVAVRPAGAAGGTPSATVKFSKFRVIGVLPLRGVSKIPAKVAF